MATRALQGGTTIREQHIAEQEWLDALLSRSPDTYLWLMHGKDTPTPAERRNP